MSLEDRAKHCFKNEWILVTTQTCTEILRKNTPSKNISSKSAWYKKTNRDVAIGPGMYTVYCIG